MAEDAFRRLVGRIDAGATLVDARPLTGGVSAQVTALVVQRADGSTERLVARLHGSRDLASNPHIARDEFRLLQIAQEHGIAAPRPIYVDESCELFPTPILVLEYVEGEMIEDPEKVSDPERHVRLMADQLVQIHTVPASPALIFLRRINDRITPRPAVLDDALNEGQIRARLESVTTLTQVNPSVLLHGDFWPGNLLWHDDAIAAVIDWEDAAIGDPLSDLANGRLEVLFFFGEDPMHAFTDQYLQRSPLDLTNLPYWDLRAALASCGRMHEWHLEPDDEAKMQELHRWFVGRALNKL